MIINASPNFIVPNDSNLHTVYSLTIPGGTLGANGSIRVTSTWSSSAAVGSHVLNVLLGGVSFTQVTFGTTVTMSELICRICNFGSALAQRGYDVPNPQTYPGASTNAIVSAALDTTQDIVLSITAQKAAPARALTLLTVTVEIFSSDASI